MNAKRASCSGRLLAVVVLLFIPVLANSQDHGNGGGGGCGDVFGDLIHILRDFDTGQPLLAKRWVELPAEAPGYGWGYCPIAVYDDEAGIQQEIPFLPYSCDFDLLDEYGEPILAVEEVDYFGRLNGGRTKERNNRMHFDEVISNIKREDVGRVTMDPTGRLMYGFTPCNDLGCMDWATVDSPMESMALYTRIMKYGHIATDPYEIDSWAHGDPKLSTQFHPALDLEDWAKFDPALDNLKPGDGKNLDKCWKNNGGEKFKDADHGDIKKNGIWDPAEPFYDIDSDGEYDAVGPPKEPFTDLNDNGVWDPAEDFEDDNNNGVRDEFVFFCAGPESLSNEDFLSSSVVLAAAASKTGMITMDLVQYVNRILKITKKTDHTVATVDTLPALYRDCYDGKEPPFPVDGEPSDPIIDLDYLDPELCGDPIEANTPKKFTNGSWVYDCEKGTPNHCLFPDLQEEFVDFNPVEYHRADAVIGSSKTDVILNYTPEWDSTGDAWNVRPEVALVSWVKSVNGESYFIFDINGFVDATSDVLRSIEWIHNYSIPDDLYCLYETVECNVE